MKLLMSFISTFILWMLLFWSVEPAVIVVGAAFALLVSVALGRVYPDNLQTALHPVRWLCFLIYVPYFFYYCIKANIDVMLRVVNPNLPIRPGIVRVRTTLTSEMAKTFLANSITLTPGTLTIDIDGQDFYVHWINIDTDNAERRTAEICGRFEPLLRRIFE